MLDKVIENNRVCIIGEIVSEFTFSHEVFGEGFYIANVSVNRLSDMVDVIPLMISERLIDVTKDYRGMKIEVAGQFRSYNRHEGTKNKLVLSIFVRELRFLEEDEMPEEQSKSNQIFLDGYVCKPPIYRKTPLGREIADVLVAVNRPYGKSDYIPCIAWGRNARFAGGIEVGSHLQVSGRVQSREYTKKIGEDEVERRVAYEVSVSKIDLVEDEE
ncbi:MAG: single-stranded DNA-binding protein [Lachnospira sp.]|nr:single-stranded DNA-binding protein [Lachnospira sp.]